MRIVYVCGIADESSRLSASPLLVEEPDDRRSHLLGLPDEEVIRRQCRHRQIEFAGALDHRPPVRGRVALGIEHLYRTVDPVEGGHRVRTLVATVGRERAHRSESLQIGGRTQRHRRAEAEPEQADRIGVLVCPLDGVFQVGLLASALVPVPIIEPEARDATLPECVAHGHEPPVGARSAVLGMGRTRDDDSFELRVRALVRRAVRAIERSTHVPTAGHHDVHRPGFV